MIQNCKRLWVPSPWLSVDLSRPCWFQWLLFHPPLLSRGHKASLLPAWTIANACLGSLGFLQSILHATAWWLVLTHSLIYTKTDDTLSMTVLWHPCQNSWTSKTCHSGSSILYKHFLSCTFHMSVLSACWVMCWSRSPSCFDCLHVFAHANPPNGNALLKFNPLTTHQLLKTQIIPVIKWAFEIGNPFVWFSSLWPVGELQIFILLYIPYENLISLGTQTAFYSSSHIVRELNWILFPTHGLSQWLEFLAQREIN